MLAEDFYFATGIREVDTWQDYLSRADRYQYGPKAPWVPASFLVAEVEGRIVGRASIRFEMDPSLAHDGGHIGYGVIPSERRKGYATEILIQSLDIVFRAGIQRVLVTCTVDNESSMRVIQRCGGVLESVVESPEGELVRRFWIEQYSGSQLSRTSSLDTSIPRYRCRRRDSRPHTERHQPLELETLQSSDLAVKPQCAPPRTKESATTFWGPSVTSPGN